MSGVLRDLAWQLASLVAVFGGTLGMLALGYVINESVHEYRAAGRELRACERLQKQQALGRHERITGEQIAERRR